MAQTGKLLDENTFRGIESPQSLHAFDRRRTLSGPWSGRTQTEVCVASELGTGAKSIEARTIQKLRIRILPFVFLLYVVAYLDRINIGFAALTMNKELAITSQQFGFLAGFFFFGYFIFEVPSNLLLHSRSTHLDRSDSDYLGNCGRADRLHPDCASVVHRALSLGAG